MITLRATGRETGRGASAAWSIDCFFLRESYLHKAFGKPARPPLHDLFFKPALF